LHDASCEVQYKSSDKLMRGHCSKCASPTSNLLNHAPGVVMRSFPLANFERDERGHVKQLDALKPMVHGFYDSRLHDFADDLPKFEKFPGYADARHILCDASGAPLPRLIYFDSYGRAELARLLFAAAGAGAKYDDCRLPSAYAGTPGNQSLLKWPDFKPHVPYGQLPVLEVNGVFIAQSAAIARFVAYKYALMGDTPLENALVDATLEQVRDVGMILPTIQAMKEEERAAAKLKFINELATHAGSLEAQLKNNGGVWMVGKRLSAADISVYRLFQMSLRAFDAAAFEKNCPPLLMALLARVETQPNIAEYLKTRPVRPV